MAKARSASHAGSWYSSDPSELDGQLGGWLQAARKTEGTAKAVISPHAGYDYSGATAAWAYKQIEREKTRTVVLLGPSHHEYLQGCALPWADTYKTPIGDILIDQEIVASLATTGHYQKLSMKAERAEHSLEMQLPYLRKVMGDTAFTLVPIVVGELSQAQQRTYTEDLLPVFERPGVVVVVSSDFCVSGEAALGGKLRLFGV